MPTWRRPTPEPVQSDRAIEQYGRALELGPEFHDLRYRMARLAARGRPRRSRPARHWKRCCGPGPRSSMLRQHSGSRIISQATPHGAREVWQACLERRPENSRVEAYLAMLDAGWAVIPGQRSLVGLVGLARPGRCSSAGITKRRGDQAYGEGRYAEALSEYRTAVAKDPDARVWAKTGAAALRTGNLEVAADAYLRLAAEDPTRVEEAAEGLESVARAADRTSDGQRLEAAVVGLGTIAPDRSIARYALAVIRRPGAEANDLVAVFPGAIAAAPDAETVDSLLSVIRLAAPRNVRL